MSAPKQHWTISVAAVIVAMMAIQMSSLGFSPLLPAIRRELAASYSQMGLFTGMYGLTAIFISLPAGMMAARFGEKRMLLSGLAVTALGLASLGFAHSYAVALASRAVWLVGYRFAFICVFTAMAVGAPEKYRSRTMGILGALAALASVIGAPFGTRLAEWFGWRGGIFGFAVIAVFGGGLFAALYRPGAAVAASAAGSHGHAFTGKSWSALRNPLMWGTDSSWACSQRTWADSKRDILRALRGGERLRSERQRIGGHHQLELFFQHLSESCGRLAVRPLLALEHNDRSGGAADSRQLCSPVP